MKASKKESKIEEKCIYFVSVIIKLSKTLNHNTSSTDK